MPYSRVGLSCREGSGWISLRVLVFVFSAVWRVVCCVEEEQRLGFRWRGVLHDLEGLLHSMVRPIQKGKFPTRIRALHLCWRV